MPGGESAHLRECVLHPLKTFKKENDPTYINLAFLFTSC